jgi:hypothetical protein
VLTPLFLVRVPIRDLLTLCELGYFQLTNRVFPLPCVFVEEMRLAFRPRDLASNFLYQTRIDLYKELSEALEFSLQVTAGDESCLDENWKWPWFAIG